MSKVSEHPNRQRSHQVSLSPEIFQKSGDALQEHATWIFSSYTSHKDHPYNEYLIPPDLKFSIKHSKANSIG
jgi:hypothetical protein